MNTKLRVATTLAITLAVIVGVALFALNRFADSRERGTAGFVYLGDSGDKEWEFSGFFPGKVMMTYPGLAADRAGIRTNDRLIAINGIPISDISALVKLNAEVRSGDTLTYRVERQGRQLDLRVTFASALHTPLVITYIVVNAFVALCFVAIGLVIFLSKPDDPRVSVLYAMTTVGGISIFGYMLIAIDNTSMRGIVVSPIESLVPLALIGIFVIAFAPLALHLALVFPRRRPLVEKYPSTIRWVYVFPFVGMLLAFLFGVFAAAAQQGDKRVPVWFDKGFGPFLTIVAITGLLLALRLARLARTEGWRRALWQRPGHTSLAFFGSVLGLARIAGALKLKPLAFALGLMTTGVPALVLALYPIFTCIVLYRAYRDSGVEERRQVKWPLWGTFIALATKILFAIGLNGVIWYMFLSGADVSRFVPVSYALQLIPTLVYLLIPISFAAAILKYRLMNIDIIIRKTVVYGILSGVILVVYLVLVGGLGTLLVNATGVQNQTVVIASTLIVALFFVPVRNKLQTLVDRNLFRHKYDYPEALAAITASAKTAEDPAEFLTSAAEKVQQALQNRSVVIFLERHGEYVATAKIGVADTILGNLRVPASISTNLDRPFDPRRRTLTEDVAGPLRRVEAELVIPISTRGFMSLAPKLSGMQYDIEDIDFLASTADAMAIGIDRIRMQVDEEDVTQAQMIQQSLLPRTMPRVNGLDVSGIWQPARSVGGDYYDLIELTPTMLAVCIGDVAGKGMPAALLMSGLQAAVRASATPTTSPREVVERVRRVVVSSLSGGRFVTFFFAVIDTSAMKIRWCNAGHNAPILVRADGSIARLETGGAVLSRISRDAELSEAEAPIQPGDRIVLFTDGVSEARDADANDFGEERLAQLVSANRWLAARQLQDAIVNTALGFSRGELEDDVTLVVAAVTQPA